jgi:hypothetical protein
MRVNHEDFTYIISLLHILPLLYPNVCLLIVFLNNYNVLWRIARRRFSKHAKAFAVTSLNSKGKVFSLWSAPRNNRVAVFSARGPCQEDMTEYGNVNWLQLVPKFRGNSSVARRRIRRLRVQRYMCCNTSILGVCNLVRLLQFLCYKSVARKRIVKTSGNRLRRLVWSDCKLCKSTIV